MGPEAKFAVPVLTELLGDTDGGVQRAAAATLGNMGPEAKFAIPTIAKLLLDRDGQVRVAAAEALAKIVPQDKAPAVLRTHARRRGQGPAGATGCHCGLGKNQP